MKLRNSLVIWLLIYGLWPFVAHGQMPTSIKPLWDQAQALDKQKNYQKAIEIYKRAIQQFLPQQQQDNYQLVLARLYDRIGKNYSPDRLAQFPSFFKYSEKAKIAIQKTTDTKYKGNIIYMVAVAYFYYRKYKEAAQLLEENIQLAQKTQDKLLELRTSGLIGRLHLNNAQYDAALRYFERCERLVPQVPKLGKVYKGQVNFNMAMVKQRIGENKQAIDYYKKTAELWENAYDQGPASARVIAVYYIMADLYVFLEKASEARYYLTKVFAADNHQIQQQRGGHYYLKGRVLHLEKKFLEAIEAYKKAIEIQDKVFGPNSAENTEIYRNLSNSYRDCYQFEKALQTIQTSLVLNNQNFSSMDIEKNPTLEGANIKETQTFALAGKGLIWKRWYDRTQNLNYLKKAYRAYQYMLKQMKEWKLSQTYENNLLVVLQYSRGLFIEAIEVLHAMYKETNDIQYLQEAFLVAEQNKAYILLRSLHLTSQSNTQGINQVEAKLTQQINKTQESLTAEQGKKTANAQVINQFKEQLFRLKASRDSLQKALKKAAPEYYRTKYQFEVANAQTIQQKLLPPQSVLIEYMLGEQQLFIFTLTKGQLSLKQVPLPLDFEAKLKTLRNSITQKNFKQFTQLGYQFHQLLVGDLPIPTDTKKLWVIPDGILYYLPWETLLTQPYAQASVNYQALPYLLKKYVVSYDYSANLIYSKKVLPQKLHTKKLLAFSPDFKSQLAVNNQIVVRDKLRDNLSELKGAEAEAKELSKLYAGQLFLGKQATEYEFKHNLKNGSVLHLATHAIVDDERPAFSRLLFSLSGKDTLNDGYLHAYELYNLKLNAELVTLSACNTGFGKIQSGEGVMSLGRAFAYAGSPNVLMSLWSVPDKSTSEIMIRFYENLAQGMAKDKALQKAKITYLENADKITTNPFYWSSFVLIGDPKPLSLRPSLAFYQQGLFWWLMGMLLIGGIIGFLGKQFFS